ncbi:MAG: L,D-transpeptidase [Polyangiaceae bacterium]|nr:L,D-transpeptidase [Polyangiaceae bacterium]
MHSAVSAETAAVESVAATIDTAAPSSTAPAPGPAAKRIYSVGQTTWIRKTTEVREGEFLGYVRTGSSVPLRSNDRVKGVGCPGGFYQVAPRGYVCADRTVTDNPPAGFAAAAEATRGTTAALPYRYALSDGAPMYNRIPTKKEQERYEPPWLHKPHVFHKLPKTLRSHEELATNDVIEPTDEVPAFLQNGGSAKEGAYDLVEQTIPLGSMLSYTKAFEADGRTWLLSADHTIVPADRVRPFRMSTFRGVDLVATKTKLPIAFMRVGAKPKYRKRGDSIDKTGAQWAVRTSVALSGASIEVGGKKYLEVNENDDGGAQLYIAETDATVIDREPDRPHGVKEKQKWFLIRLSQGTLVAYEDLEPVYATLVSPGRGGLPVKGRDNVQDSTTPTGAFSITFKDRAATMSPEKGKDRTFWISDVPYTQYFNPPFALHAAYWHERFGEFVSAGCVNLSPLDAEALFTWSDPGVPLDWQGATGAGAKENGATTIVVVRR